MLLLIEKPELNVNVFAVFLALLINVGVLRYTKPAFTFMLLFNLVIGKP